MPSSVTRFRSNSVVFTSITVFGVTRSTNWYAPVTRGLSRSASIVTLVASRVGRSSQNSVNDGNSSPDGNPVSIASPRPESPNTWFFPTGRK